MLPAAKRNGPAETADAYERALALALMRMMQIGQILTEPMRIKRLAKKPGFLAKSGF